MLLFWMSFLPTGARASVDEAYWILQELPKYGERCSLHDGVDDRTVIAEELTYEYETSE